MKILIAISIILLAGTLESVPSNEASGVLRPNKPANVRIP